MFNKLLAHSSQGQSLLPTAMATTWSSPIITIPSAFYCPVITHHLGHCLGHFLVSLFLICLPPLKTLNGRPNPLCLLHFPLPSTEPGRSRC